MGSLDRAENLEPAARRGDLGRRGHRRRGHRAGRRRGRRRARLSDGAPGGPRLRPGDLEPEHQADPRRRALPGPGGYPPGPRGAPRAGRAVPQRPAPGPSPGIRRAGLSMAGPALLRDRPEALRRPGRPIQPRRLAAGSGPAQVVERIPTIVAHGLRGGIVYTDGQFDDARLAISLARTFADLGGTALNHAPVAGFTRRDGRIAAVAARDEETGEELTIAARVVINATGVFADAIRRLDDPGTAVCAPADAQPGDARRPRSLVPPRRECAAGPAHRRRPRPVHDPLARSGPGRDDRYAGPRAGRRAAAQGRGDRLSPRLRGPVPGEASRCRTTSGARSPASGRCSAAITPARATSARRRRSSRASTPSSSRLRAWSPSPAGNGRPTDGWRPTRSTTPSRSAACPHALHRPPRSDSMAGTTAPTDFGDPLSVYGSDAAGIRTLAAENPEWDRPLHPALPYRTAEVVWAARHEAARSRRGRARTPDPRPVPRRPRQHRGRSDRRRAPGGRVRPGQGLAGGPGRPVPRAGGRLPRLGRHIGRFHRRRPVNRVVPPPPVKSGRASGAGHTPAPTCAGPFPTASRSLVPAPMRE